MRIRLLSTRGAGQNWREGTHEETMVWAKRLAHYGVSWKEVCLPAYVDTLNTDPIYEQRIVEESAVVVEDFPVSALATLAMDYDVTIAMVPSIRWTWVEDGDPICHSLVVSDEG